VAPATQTILIVDDEPSDLELVEEVLARRGYTVITAKDANHAIALAQRNKFDLLLTDVAMAPVNGCELAMQLMASRQDLRVLFVSGHVGEEALRYQKVPAGARFLRKPFTADDLLRKVRESLQDRPEEGSFSASAPSNG
jgi:DNA-binding response OmpR family regulator